MSGNDAGTRLRAAADGARAGDREAFRALVEETHATVFRLAVALVSDRDEAADVTQETYVRAWGRIDELRDVLADRTPQHLLELGDDGAEGETRSR